MIYFHFIIKSKAGRSFEGTYCCDSVIELKRFIKTQWMTNAMPPAFDLRTLKIISKVVYN